MKKKINENEKCLQEKVLDPTTEDQVYNPLYIYIYIYIYI